MGIGLLLLAAAQSLTTYNLWSEAMAGSSAKAALEQLKPDIPNTQTMRQTQERPNNMSLSALPSGKSQEETHIPDYILNPEMDMPEEEVDGKRLSGQSCITVRCESADRSAQQLPECKAGMEKTLFTFA